MAKLARAYKTRIKDLWKWDYWEEYIPALEELREIPSVDEAFYYAFCKSSKSKQNQGGPLTSKEARLKALDNLKIARMK